MLAAELKWCRVVDYLIYEITERDKRMFSAEDSWVLFKKRRLKFSAHACYGRPWGQRGMKWRYARNSPEASILFSTESEETDWRKSFDSLKKPVLWLKLKIPCLLRARWKISSHNCRHHPMCRGYKSRNRCIYGRRCLFRHADEKKPSARSRKAVTQEAAAILREKKSPRMCISKLRSNEFYSSETWRKLGLNASAGHTWKSQEAPGTKLEFGKEREKRQSGGIIQKSEPHERNPCAPGFEEQPPEETSWQADCSCKVAWNGETIWKLKPNIKLRFFFLWRRQTQNIVRFLFFRELKCTMLSKEN